MVRAAPSRPPPPENPHTVLEVLGSLSLAPRGWREERKLVLPLEADRIRQHITIPMEPGPLYDGLYAFFASYAEISALYNAETSFYRDGPSYGSGAFLTRLCHAPAVIAALVARNHLPTSNGLEFAGMVDSEGDLIFDVLCTD